VRSTLQGPVCEVEAELRLGETNLANGETSRNAASINLLTVTAFVSCWSADPLPGVDAEGTCPSTAR